MALVTKNFSDIITFTRASTATFFNSSGVLISAAIDAPRLDYNPATLAAQGLLIEEQRTNLLTYSEDLSNAVWTFTGQLPFGSGSTVDDGVAPDGTTTADKVVEDTSTGLHLISYPNITTSTTTTNSLSFFIKAAGRTSISVRFGSQSIANRMQANIDLNTGAVTGVQNIGTATGATCTATLLPNEWWRITASVNPNDAAATTMRFIIYPNGTTAYTGDGVSGAYIWGAQLEAGAFPTSYIPTTTIQVTRSADVASVNTLSPWYNATEGTLYSEFVWEGLKSTSGQAYAQFDDGSTNNRIVAAAGSSNANIMTTTSGGTSDGSAATPATVFAANTIYKTALALAANNLQSFVNGTAGTADTTVTLPVGLTNFKLGASLSATANVWLRRATYYPRRLSQAEGIAITT